MARSIQPPWWGDRGLQLLAGLTLWTAAPLGYLNWLPSAGVTTAALLLWSAAVVLPNGPPRRMLALWIVGPLLLLTALHADGVALGTLTAVLGFTAAWGIRWGRSAASNFTAAAAGSPSQYIALSVQAPASSLRDESCSSAFSNLSAGDEEEYETDGESLEELADSLVLQQWERRRDADGGESLSGTCYVELAANEKIRLLHLPIHPPFAGELEATLDWLEGASLAAELDLLRPYGLRIMVRRTVPLGTAVAGTLGYFVVRTAQRRAA